MNNSIVLKDIFPAGEGDYVAQANQILSQIADKTLYGSKAAHFEDLRALNNNHDFVLNVIENLAKGRGQESRQMVQDLLEELGSNRKDDDYANAYYKGLKLRAQTAVNNPEYAEASVNAEQLSY